MAAPSLPYQNGVRVPGWAVAAATVVTTLVGSGIFVGIKLEAQASQNITVNYRLCRIERALGVDPWETCMPPDRRGNTVPGK